MASRAETTIRDATAAVEELVLHLQHHLESRTGITADEVVKGGSLGHGTAVQGEFDIDLVLYSRSIDVKKVVHSGFDTWLDKLERFLRDTGNQIRSGGTIDRYSITRSPHAVQFKYTHTSLTSGRITIDVDLLVSPFWNDHYEIYAFLQTIPERKQFSYSVFASKWQVEFLKSKPPQVKEFIRRAKAWRNKTWTSSNGKPKSYTMALLVLWAYEKAEKQVGTSNTDRIARRTTDILKETVLNHRQMVVYWNSEYRYTQSPRAPCIMDPVNPTNNLYETGIASFRASDRNRDYERGDGDWTQFVQNIRSLDLTKTVDEIQGVYTFAYMY